ncbi:glycosyl transferase [Thiopseudomonas alkaliphila]|uniref:Glycosyl transferase n=1 Tax=Thiopseudomonas alkaliphila TaxID=1697053 RepID=A0A0K1XFC5_9GAMM|nr:sugar transferase [Thiopseudomonas alkaliphila]AKX60041.1 glycosyl transferase [Thiopseudomonas alkaliphila]
MTTHFHRRHSRWYEVILFSTLFQVVSGLLFIVLLPTAVVWPLQKILFAPDNTIINTMLASGLAYLSSLFIIKKLQKVPESNPIAYAVPTAIGCWAAAAIILFFLREESYSRPILLASFALMLIWIVLGAYANKLFNRKKFAVVPFGRAKHLECDHTAMMINLTQPNLGNRRFDGVIADLHTPELNAEWQRFLAQCTLARIPVYHTQHIIEALTGRVQIDHLSENQFGSLLPSSIYSGIKRFLDCVLVILLSPIILPIILIAAIAVKLDSKGGAFYNQKRMGFRGEAFTMYKLRSMRTDMPGKGYTVGEEDPRITKVGAFIRKYRIDELPQVLNILKGDMSFIGPRPESLELSKWYEKDVPFFSYRHIVRPGISGWAQVTQGYAAEVEGMTVKLEYDFYYIKNFSIWLDMLIVAKTIKTILTGFGAR